MNELVDAFTRGQMTLPALLGALDERGAVAASAHADDKAWLEQARDETRLDPQVVDALLAKLESLQPTPESVSAPAADLDLTRVQAPENPGHAVGDADDSPASGPPPPPGPREHAQEPPLPSDTEEAATRVQPLPSAPPPIHDEPVETGTDHSSGPNTSTWQRVANETGGESAYVGMRLKGRFVLEREIGRGGMGVVYLARDERKVEARDRNPHVAVKALNDEFRRHPDALIALQREARRSQQIAHDNIVRVYDFDKDGTIVFMTMEYVDGSSLRSLIREHAEGMSLARARPLIQGMAAALQHAHKEGVIHSDFKPGNVMVTRTGKPKVFDFGIARAGKQADAEADDQTVFDAGTLGALTPAYASLEMLRGADPTPSDDIYALGCVIYELLTGKHPFDKLSAEAALREGRKPPQVSGLTRRQNLALQKAVAFEHPQRWPSVDRLLDGLRDVGVRERFGRPLLYASVFVVVLLAAGWGVRQHLHARHMSQVVAGFSPGNPLHYRDETQAIAALQSLDSSERNQVVTAHGDLIQQFLIARVDAYWSPDQGRHDRASAERVFDAVHTLGLYLPLVERKRMALREFEQARAQAQPKPEPAEPKPAIPVIPDTAVTAMPGIAAKATPDIAATATPDPAAEQAQAREEAEAAQAREAARQAKARLRSVTTQLLREGEHNFTRQRYSSAIANAKAALRVDPGNADAKGLLHRAEQAQQQAMSNISIH